MKNGLYIVDRGNIYGAFVVRDGKVAQCAPILRKNIGFYMQIAQYVPTEGEPVEEPAGAVEEYPPRWRSGYE
jgi:hypothetical protein